MNGIVPRRPGGQGAFSDQEHPRLQREPLTPAERRARMQVGAAQWRAREIAESVFGRVGGSFLTAVRGSGALRGMLRLDVPFEDLALHREREAVFLAAVGTDPVLSRIPLLYVIGAAAD